MTQKKHKSEKELRFQPKKNWTLFMTPQTSLQRSRRCNFCVQQNVRFCFCKSISIETENCTATLFCYLSIQSCYSCMMNNGRTHSDRRPRRQWRCRRRANKSVSTLVYRQTLRKQMFRPSALAFTYAINLRTNSMPSNEKREWMRVNSISEANENSGWSGMNKRETGTQLTKRRSLK